MFWLRVRDGLSWCIDAMVPGELHEDVEALRRARILVGINVVFVCSAVSSMLVFLGPLWSAEWLTPIVGVACAVISGVMMWWKKDVRAPAMITSLGVCLLLFPLLYPVGGLQSRSVYWAALMPLLGIFLLGRVWGAVCVVVSILGLLGLYLAPSFGLTLPPPKFIPNKGLLIILTMYYTSIWALGWLFESSRQRALQSLATSMAEAKEMALAKETAESISKAKSAFLANMSHELRTPLNAIIGYTEILDEDLTSMSEEELREDITRIHRSGKHLLLLIEDLLDVSRIEEGKMELHVESVALTPLLAELAQDLAPKLAASGNVLTRHVDEDVPDSLDTDGRKLRQCLYNLLDNACKFTSGGEISLTVERREVKDQTRLTFVVRDNGVGISAEQLAHIFERFVQGDGSSTRRYEGTGLGLSLTKDIVGMLGGTIGVESRPGDGSTFWIELPLHHGSGSAPS